ncbi:PLP-dependent aminotransferase family protein [Ensifer sp. BR816]|uniref:aminotransferase-like domain-containing protein n=1 Tax=Rhizobium sp. (strain BR816) TaxID=1057002 RepID=UPI00037630BA|nr:PLP-dependent aminotransferase family protein [Ensifer sp. BR816]
MAIVGALAEDIELGEVAPGDRLMPQRDLAYRLGLSVGTVVRAYRVAEQRGLIAGEVGRGTYVKSLAASGEQAFFGDGARSPHIDETAPIDFSLNVTPIGQDVPRLSEALRSLSKSPDLDELIRYSPHQGLLRHRRSIANWISQTNDNRFSPPVQNIVVCNGAQHALATVVNALLSPGDTLLTEQVTYPGIKAIASDQSLKLHGVEMDEDGIRPEALLSACERTGARVLYTIPTLHNPTGITMSAPRRKAIAKIALEQELTIIEDDVYGFLAKDAPSQIAKLLPEQTYYIGGFSKVFAPGLRVGYAVVPPAALDRVLAAIRATNWMTSPLLTEIISKWIDEGIGADVLRERRAEARSRCDLALRTLGKWLNPGTYRNQASFHLWVRAPEGMSAEAFAAVAKSQGIIVTPPRAVEVAPSQAQHFRVSIGGARSAPQLQEGLERLRVVLEDPGISVQPWSIV